MKQFTLVLPKPQFIVERTLSSNFSKRRAQAIREATSAPIGIRGVLISEASVRWCSMSAGLGLHILIGVCLVAVSMLFPETLVPVRQFLATAVVKADVVAPWKPEHKRPAPKRPQEIVQTLPPALEEPFPAPRIAPPFPKAPLAGPIRGAQRTPAVPDLAEVATTVESPAPLVTPSLSIPSLKKPREGVQTGTFAGHDSADDGEPRADLNRRRGGVADANFSSGISGGTSGGTGIRLGVLQSSFDQHPESIIAKPKAVASSPDTTPVEIISKPKPLYSDEAKAKKIEGEVRLEVVFTAAGEVTVQRVVQGLGYGLDENAESAARQIRFKPAQRDRQPVDSTAIVHIVFELAS
jgi:TonB family protein